MIHRDKLPEGANVLPSTWVYAFKRDPAAEIKKHKARFCVKGDKQIEGVDYVDSYAPVVSWSTVRIMLGLAIKQGWATRQVDFSNAFVQETLDEEVYVSLPAMFQDETKKDRKSETDFEPSCCAQHSTRDSADSRGLVQKCTWLQSHCIACNCAHF